MVHERRAPFRLEEDERRCVAGQNGRWHNILKADSALNNRIIENLRAAARNFDRLPTDADAAADAVQADHIIGNLMIGAKNFDAVKRATDTAFIFLFFSSLIISIIGLIFCRQI